MVQKLRSLNLQVPSVNSSQLMVSIVFEWGVRDLFLVAKVLPSPFFKVSTYIWLFCEI